MANIKRLERLIVVLEGVAADPNKVRDFDMGNWAKATPSCGTHACACGWGAMDLELQAEGLTLVSTQYATCMEPFVQISYKEWRGFAAAKEFFDISLQAAIRLFDEDEYDGDERDIIEDEGRITEKVKIYAVISRLKSFVDALPPQYGPAV